MLLAALSLLRERARSAGDTRRSQVMETAITQILKTFKSALLGSGQQDQSPTSTHAGQPTAWQQVRHVLTGYLQNITCLVP